MSIRIVCPLIRRLAFYLTWHMWCVEWCGF